MQEINDDFLEEGRLVIDIDIDKLLAQLSKERAFKKQALMIKSELKEVRLLERDISKITNMVHRKRKLQDICLLYTSPSPRDRTRSRMPSSA